MYNLKSLINKLWKDIPQYKRLKTLQSNFPKSTIQGSHLINDNWMIDSKGNFTVFDNEGPTTIKLTETTLAKVTIELEVVLHTVPDQDYNKLISHHDFSISSSHQLERIKICLP